MPGCDLLRLCVIGVVFVAASGSTEASDWPFWRGPQHNGVSREAGLPERWDPKGGPGSNLLWRNDALAGQSTPIVMAGKLYTLVRDRPDTELEGEKVVCADAASGEILWEHRFNVRLTDASETQIGSSSVVGDQQTSRVYAQGAAGYFCCLEGDAGRVVWERSLSEEIGAVSYFGCGTHSPLIHDDTVVTAAVVIGWGDTPKWSQMATPAHRVMAFDKATGELRWLSHTQLTPPGTEYGAPTIATLAGQRAIVFGAADGAVWAMQAGTGKPLWNYSLSGNGLCGSPIASPDGRIFVGHSAPNPDGEATGVLAALDGTRVGDSQSLNLSDPDVNGEFWKVVHETLGKASPLFADDRLYACTDAGELLLINPATGDTIARETIGRWMRGSPVYADGRIYACSHDGQWAVLSREEGPTSDPSDDRIEVLHRVTLHDEQVDASPVVADGRLYLSTSETMYCIGVEGQAASPTAALPPRSSSNPADKRIAQLQLVPWDVLLSPGEERGYRVRLYNAAGEFLREAPPTDVSFGVSGPGEITVDGVYRPAPDSSHDVALVLCEYKGMKSRGRVRIVPPLPWNFDFEGGADAPPLTWVGGRVRYEMREDAAGDHFMAKLTELPAKPDTTSFKYGARSRMWMGSHTLANYTVQADIQMQQVVAVEATDDAAEAEERPQSESATPRSSAGLINSGYTFTLFGPDQEARLYSWRTHAKRTHASVAMPLEAGVWYRTKLSVVPDDSRKSCTVQAKVWQAGEAEPGAWTLSFVDEAPNLAGSPGLFGDATEAEFYVDNLSVTPN